MEQEVCSIGKARILNEKLQEIMSQQPFKPILKDDGVTGMVIIRLRGDTGANILLIGHIYEKLVLETVLEALAKGRQIAEGENNELAS